MRLRRLNEAGIQQLSEFLDVPSMDLTLPWPERILTDEATSEQVVPEVSVERKLFSTRLEVASYLNEKLSDTGIRNLDKDRGLWSWLALFYSDLLCPPTKGGRRKPGKQWRWIPTIDDFYTYYRHLLLGPYLIYRAHRDNLHRALALLCGPVHAPGEIVEQIASRLELVTNAAVVEVATDMYLDKAAKRPKHGAGGKGAASPRRFAEILNQFAVTWDLHALDAKGLLAMLPAEFDRFRPAGS